ncbi:unnamed protein product [Rhizophagus irregularis]|nr:unnamed protein product [Rhizophagus irregularis]
MDYSSTEVFGTELTEIENKPWFSSLFYLDQCIPTTSCIMGSMDYSSTEVFGILYQVGTELTEIENKPWFSSLFYLDKYIPTTSYINLVINDEIRPTFLYFHGEVEIYKLYSVFACLLPNEYIKNSTLSIKNASGLEVGSWKIYENNIIDNYDVSCESVAQSLSSSTTPISATTLFYPSPLSEASTSPTASPDPNTALFCINCGVKETPLWRRKRMERYCNACCLYLKRNGIHRKLNGNKVLRKKRKKKNHSCAECNTNYSPIWRHFDDKIYCNKHGLAKKKRLFPTYYNKNNKHGLAKKKKTNPIIPYLSIKI